MGRRCRSRSHGNPALEIGLTIIPAIILIAVGIPTVSTVFSLAKTSDTQCVVNVTGQQWWWEYEYPVQNCGDVDIAEPIVTSGELVMPTKVNVLLRITSNDVIHSYWIPKLNGKRDAVPGRVHPLRMEADRTGHLRRSVHRVLWSQPRPNAHGRGRPVSRRLHDVGGQPVGAGPKADR